MISGGTDVIYQEERTYSIRVDRHVTSVGCIKLNVNGQWADNDERLLIIEKLD